MTTMSNSALVAVTVPSPNHSGPRTHSIDRITPHCVVGQCTAENLGSWFANPSRQASSNYGIGKDGRVGLYVDEGNRSWCSSSTANDQRAVTIECASDKKAPFAMNWSVYNTLIELCADICRRNGKMKLLWIDNKDQALMYTPAADEMLLTVHCWFAKKDCPGSWLMSRLGELARTVTEQLNPAPVEQHDPAPVKNGQFADVQEGTWYADAVKRVSEKGLMNGYGDGRFGPNDPVTRAQLAVVLDKLTKGE